MRKTNLKRASTGVVITVVVIVALLGILRARLFQPGGAAAQEGSALFAEKGCGHCHYTDSKDTKIGPGLKGLFERDALPVSGRPVTEENVRDQLETPYENMPSFAGRLTRQEADLLIGYLQSL